MEKKISKKALSRSFHHWYYGNLTCFTQEHMQTFGYLASMLPIVEDLYDNKDDQKRSMNTYTAFFNTEPQIGALVVGITAGLEEARANQSGEVDDETINGLRAGLMGPLAGIGDSLIVGTLIPILLGVSMGLSSGGSPIGAIFYIVVWNLLAYFGMKFAYYKGYELGGKAVEFLVGPVGNSLRKAIGCLGAMVIGAVAASWVPITTAISLKNASGKEYLNLQNQLDGVYPGLLTGVFIVFCWWLMAKKNVSPIKVMLLLVVIAFLGVLCGFFNPGLKY
jgi:mannose/fructose/N-acetylgalactosamine-specific phosphotransferase system component IID